MIFHDYYVAALRRGWFDPNFYFDLLQSKGISIRDTELSLFEHFATIGWKSGLSPSDRFAVDPYLARYHDVNKSQVDPLYHYLTRGQRERRKAFALHDPPEEVRFVGVIQCHPDRLENERQLALARANGISAFGIHYDAGRFRNLTDLMDPETSFCLFFDYGNWAHRKPEESEAAELHDPSLEAQYGLFNDVLEILSDPRYLRICGKPLLVVFSPERLEDTRLTFELWREVARRAGLRGLFVAGLAETGEIRGLDALIGAPVITDRMLPVFPGFMPDRNPSAWPREGAGASEAFTTWSASAPEQAKVLLHRGLAQLVFIDARSGWGGGYLEFLKGAALEQDRKALSELHRFAETITTSDRLPLLFLSDGMLGDEQGPARRLIASLAETDGLACFVVVERGGPASDLDWGAPWFSLGELDGLGWSRDQIIRYLAGLLRARSDLVVVSVSLATADLLAPFATHGHGIASFLDELPAPIADDVARCVHRIVVRGESMRQHISAAWGVPKDDIQVVLPPRDLGKTLSWPRYVEDIRKCLLGLGNGGTPIRLTGRTVGRQEIANDLCVVIPSYNHKPFILAALDSILAQSVRPKEIRIIDDGSADGSAELVKSLASEKLGIFVEARENRGAHITINQGIAETACPIVSVMNSDDQWHPLRIEQLIGDLRRPGGADVVFSRVRFMGQQDRCEQKRRWYERGIADYRNGSPLWLSLMFCNFFMTTSNLIARRDKFLKLGGFAPLRYCHDLDYMLKAIFAGHNVHFVEQTLCDYRVHTRNTIDQDVRKVLFEEAWIIANFLRLNFGQISEPERLIVAQRICDKGLATRVIGILRAGERNDLALIDKLIYIEPHFGEILEDSQVRAPDMLQEMARLVQAEAAEALR